MKANTCSSETITEVCRTNAGERPRYFPRQLVTAEDLTLDQEYFRNRLRLHNRLLHGWGVVCGLQVAPVMRKDGAGGMEPWKVRICQGYALGPYGDDIMVPCEVELDIREDSVSGSSVEPCETIRDVWCSDVMVDRGQGGRFCLAIKYKELSTRPIRVQPAGCGCDDSACEFSRLRDGYEIKALTESEYRAIASSTKTTPSWQELFIAPNNANPACLCPEHPWVFLACLEIDAQGKITLIDNCGPRRLVAALGGFYWSCTKIRLESISDSLSFPGEFRCGGSQQSPITLGRRGDPANPVVRNTLYLEGAGFQDGLKVDLGPGISVKVTDTNTTIVTVEAIVSDTAERGLRDVVVVNPDCSTAFCAGAVEVPQPQAPASVPRAEMAQRERRAISREPDIPESPRRGRTTTRTTTRASRKRSGR